MYSRSFLFQIQQVFEILIKFAVFNFLYLFYKSDESKYKHENLDDETKHVYDDERSVLCKRYEDESEGDIDECCEKENDGLNLVIVRK